MADVAGKRCARSIGFYRDLNNLTTASFSDDKLLKKRRLYKEVYEVEELVGSRYNKSLKEQEFLVKWKGWGSEFNSWEPGGHILDQELIRQYENPKNLETVVQHGAEIIMNIVEGGLANSLQTETTVIMQHSIIRQIFVKKEVVAGHSLALYAEDFPLKYFRKGWDRAYINRRGTLRGLIYPIYLRPFLSKSKQLFNEKGEKQPRRYMQKITISFRKKTF